MTFPDATATVVEDPVIGGKLAFHLVSPGKPTYTSTQSADIKKHLVTAGIVDQNGAADPPRYNTFEKAAFSNSPEEFLKAVLQAIPIPEVRESLVFMRLLSPLNVIFLQSHLVVASPNVEFEDDPCARGGASSSSSRTGSSS